MCECTYATQKQENLPVRYAAQGLPSQEAAALPLLGQKSIQVTARKQTMTRQELHVKQKGTFLDIFLKVSKPESNLGCAHTKTTATAKKKL